MEVEQLLKYAKILSRKDLDFDCSLTFYYDETNNIKKLHLKKGDFNVDYTANFVLGGFAFVGEKPDLEDIFNGITLQPNVNEVKLKLIATGDFEACLTSRKLTTFLTNLSDKPLYLHISTLNLLYYSIVDIVDSAPLPDSLLIYRNGFKTALYKACRENMEAVIPLLVMYTYPNIPHDSLVDFVEELMTAIASFKSDRQFGPSIEKLHEFLTIGAANDNLPFITDEEDNMLIKGLLDLYARPIYTFKNSQHIFDNEVEIKEQLPNYPLLANPTAFSNYSFLDSKDDKLIQICDVTVGLLGKFFKFLNNNSIEVFTAKIGAMTQTQTNNLDMLLRMFEKSFSFNEALIHFVDTFDTQVKIAEIGKLRSINLGT